jgi:hypothetical protein
MSAEWKTFAIAVDKDRAAMWQRIFGGIEAPVKSVVPGPAFLPGVGATMVYELDLSAITPEQRERLVKEIAGKFKLPEWEVDQTLDEIGCPILADDVVIASTDIRQIMMLVD